MDLLKGTSSSFLNRDDHYIVSKLKLHLNILSNLKLTSLLFLVDFIMMTRQLLFEANIFFSIFETLEPLNGGSLLNLATN